MWRPSLLWLYLLRLYVLLAALKAEVVSSCGVHPYYGYTYYGYTYLLAALKTEVVSACGGLRSVSSMAVMPRLHKSTLTGAEGGGGG